MNELSRKFPWKEYKPFFVIGGLVLILIVAVAVISAFWPRYEERFFELGLLGRNKMAEDYYPNGNSTLEVGSEVRWFVYIHNHMRSVQDVLVRVKLLNSTMPIPDDRGHIPSMEPYFFELLVSLDIDETKEIPFPWSIDKAHNTNDTVTVNRLLIYEETVDVDVSTTSDIRFRMVFELWVLDESSGQYLFGWDSGKEFRSASLYMWFGLASPAT